MLLPLQALPLSLFACLRLGLFSLSLQPLRLLPFCPCLLLGLALLLQLPLLLPLPCQGLPAALLLRRPLRPLLLQPPLLLLLLDRKSVV